MNNKGFTLVELLAVIVILASLSIVAVISVTSSLQRREDKECQEQISLAKNAAKIYFSLNDVTTITVKKLKDEKYFDEPNKINKLKDTDSVTMSSSGYTFTGTGACKSS